MTVSQKNAIIIALISCIVLAGAYSLEHALNLKVCHSCWMQRYAWFATLGASSVALLPSGIIQKIALWCARVGLVVVLYYSMEQALQQYGIIDAKMCSLKDMILGISCADKGFTIFGLTLAVYSAITSIGAMILSFTRVRRLLKSIL